MGSFFFLPLNNLFFYFFGTGQNAMLKIAMVNFVNIIWSNRYETVTAHTYEDE